MEKAMSKKGNADKSGSFVKVLRRTERWKLRKSENRQKKPHKISAEKMEEPRTIKDSQANNLHEACFRKNVSIKPEDHGVSVKAIRQTKTGDVLIELRAKKEDRDCFESALAAAVGDMVVFVTLSQREDYSNMTSSKLLRS